MPMLLPFNLYNVVHNGSAAPSFSVAGVAETLGVELGSTSWSHTWDKSDAPTFRRTYAELARHGKENNRDALY